MSRLFRWPDWRTIGAGLLGALVLGPASHSAGRPAQQGGQDAQARQFLGAGGCAQCHEQPGGRNQPDFVQLNEYPTWKSKDKHSQAYEKLLTPRSKEMAELVGIKDVTNVADPNNACIRCHAVAVDEKQQARGFEIKDGVSCDACHGPASAWVFVHANDRNWRNYSPAEKHDKFGMLDLRDPVVRSQMCLSCHVGDASQGRVLTHAMYAAGHPPLPGIEVATFSEQEPRHWRHLRDVPFLQKAKPEIQKLYRFDTAPCEQTRLVLLGGLISLQSSMELLARQAESKNAWPELANFDCSACHHDLKLPSWRQKRGYPGIPGRPQMRDWPTALVKVALRYLGEPDHQLDVHLKSLAQAFDAQPFGKPADVRQAAAAVAGWTKGLIEKIQQEKCEGATRKLLQAICAVSVAEYPDYDSARQLAWAFRAAYRELDPKPANDKQIQETLAALDRQLKLDLPSGTDKSIVDELKPSLENADAYDPDRFKQSMSRLAELLKD